MSASIMGDVLELHNVLAEHERSSTISPVPGPSGNKRPLEDPHPETDLELETLEECLKQNKHSRNLVSLAESKLQSLLEESNYELKRMREKIAGVENGKSHELFYHYIHSVCSTPYFKDSYGFTPPANEDVILRKCQGFIDLCNVPQSVPWTEEEKNILLGAIRQSEIERWTEIAKKAGTLKYCDFEKKTLGELVGTRKREYDWLKMSVTDFKNSRTEFECRIVWFNYLHPSINKGIWTEKEDTDLLKLVKKHRGLNWDIIVKELHTNRSAYQCFGHYIQRLRNRGRKKWTEEKNAHIENYIKKFSAGGYVPWNKIAKLEGCSAHALYRHWVYRNPGNKKIPYSLQEDTVIAAGIKLFGNDYARIADFLPNRSNVQVCGRAHVLQSHESYKTAWNSEEDTLLCKMVEKYGFGKWSEISAHFLNWDGKMCSNRYKAIVEWKEKHGPDSMPPAGRKRKFKNWNGTLSDLWKNAQKTVGKENIDTNCNANMKEKLLRNLSKGLLKQNVGRRPGSRNPEFLDKEFFKMFSSCYTQKGGKGKTSVSQELMPYMLRDVIMTLNLVNANLVLPKNPECIDNDFHIPEVDKMLLKFLITHEELVRNMQESMNAIRASSMGSMAYLCPPNFTTLVGLRSLLLKKRSLTAQAEGDTLIPYAKHSSESSSETEKGNSCDKFRAACLLWNERIQFLFTWPALTFRVCPNEKFPVAPTSPMQFRRYGNKQVCKPERIRKKKAKPKIDEPPKVKRAYNRTGKYKKVVDPNGVVRRSSRRYTGSVAEPKGCVQ